MGSKTVQSSPRGQQIREVPLANGKHTVDVGQQKPDGKPGHNIVIYRSLGFGAVDCSL